MESIPLDFTDTPAVENNKYEDKMQFEASGPCRNERSKTDVCWLVGFILYLVVWISVIVYAFATGNTSKGLKPRDSAGRICGYDSGVESKPYLVHYNPENCDVPHCLACQSECPQEDFNFERYDKRSKRAVGEMSKRRVNRSGKSRVENRNGEPSGNGNAAVEMTSADIRTTTDSGDGETKSSGGKFDEAMKSIVCQSDVNLDLTKRMDELRHFVQSGKCSRTYRKTERVEDYRCGLNATASGRQPERAGIARELYKAKYSIAGFVALSGLTALASVWLMRWHAQAYACASIFAGCALAFRCIYEKCVLDAESKTNGVLLALFLGVVALVLVVLLAIYFRTELSLACRAIEECCKAVTCVPSSLAVPLLSFAVYALAFVLGASAYRPLSSLESPVYKVDYADGEGCQCPTELGYSQNATCDPLAFDSQCQRETGTPCLLSGCYMLEKRAQSVGFLHLVNWLGLAWGFLLVTGFNDIVLASVFSTWYWTFDKKMLSYLSVIDSFWAVSTCHLGTVALGSLVIPICTTLETIVNCAKRCLRKTTRPCTAVMLLGLTSAFDQVEKFVQFIDRRAYVTCAMHGTDFFQSARTAHYLCMRNAESVVAVVTVTNWLTFMINALIACASTRIASSYYAYRADDDLSRSGAPLLLIFVGSYAICCMFTRVIEIAVDTVFVCFLEDIERNDGTSEKPYFTSERLAKLFRKK